MKRDVVKKSKFYFSQFFSTFSNYKKKNSSLGTTKKGIGPTYSSKVFMKKTTSKKTIDFISFAKIGHS